jgi:membrane-bound ClpP family serine protease
MVILESWKPAPPVPIGRRRRDADNHTDRSMEEFMPGFDQTLLWAVLLLLLGISCLVLEMFVPSGGLLGLMAALSIVGAIVLAFISGPLAGLVMTITVTFLIPTMLALAVKYWPETPLGRVILLRRPKGAEEVLPQTEAYRTINSLIGKHGIAKSMMLPSGVVLVEGKTYDAVSNGLPIEPGQNVRVVAIDTQRLVVRVDDEPFREPAEAADEASAGPLTESPLPGIEDPFA